MAACPCGALIPEQGRGRPRKFCLECRPRDVRPSRPSNPRPEVRAGITCAGCAGAVPRGRLRFCSDACRGPIVPSRRGACATCGTPIQISHTSRGAHLAQCRPCRHESLRAARLAKDELEVSLSSTRRHYWGQVARARSTELPPTALQSTLSIFVIRSMSAVALAWGAIADCSLCQGPIETVTGEHRVCQSCKARSSLVAASKKAAA